jgi:serine/threonine protein phosphatase PrpC
MTWKVIGKSVTGTSHAATGKGCEDATGYTMLTDRDGNEVLVCCVSDGAGSAQFAAIASELTVKAVVDFATHFYTQHQELTEADIYAMAEEIYTLLELEALAREAPIDEFSCTLLGSIVTKTNAAFFQIGDGAIIRNDPNGGYATVWWPQSGEYHNTTSFLSDDSGLSNLQVAIIDEEITELALLTDGLQMLVLNMETTSVHQPFFGGLFHHLRHAAQPEQIETLNDKLATYLDSPQINARTDDDKTLLLATRMNP